MAKTKLLPAIWFAAIFFMTCFDAAASDGALVGALEDVPGGYSGEANSFHVRVMFHKSGDHWAAFPNNCGDVGCLERAPSLIPQHTLWSVTFDGKILGKLEAAAPASYGFYSSIDLQDVVSDKAVPTIGTRSMDFGGFMDTAVFRPLVTVSTSRFDDPDRWKPISNYAAPLQKLRQIFRAKFPKLCRANEKDETRLDPFPYHDGEVKLAKAYVSGSGWIVAGLHLDQAIDCKDTEAGFGMDDPWFAIKPDGSTLYLDSGIWLVDAGDYDQDGKSELVFAISRYNRGGYELFYDDFTKRAVFRFSYH